MNSGTISHRRHVLEAKALKLDPRISAYEIATVNSYTTLAPLYVTWTWAPNIDLTAWAEDDPA